MAAGYLYRPELVARVRRALSEGAAVLWGPPGFGKTLLLKELARVAGLAYRREPGEGPAAYDLDAPPADFCPGAVYALPVRPRATPELLLFGPETLRFSEAEVKELARRLGAARLWPLAVEKLGGWPVLVRRGLEAGVADPAEEPLRGLLEGFLARLAEPERALLGLLLVPLPEAAWRQAGHGPALDGLLRGGWVRGGARVRPLAALVSYLEATQGPPPFEAVQEAIAAALALDPEAAFSAYLAYRRPEAGRAFELLAERLLPEGAFDRLVEAWDRLPPEFRTPKGALFVAQAERSRGHLDAALALARWAARDPEVYALAKDVEGSVLIHLGRYRDAARAFEDGLTHADPALKARMLTGLGAALIRDGRYREAARVLRQAVEACPTADVYVLARAEQNLGIALHHLGHLEQAVAAYREALKLKENQGPLTQANTLLSMGEALRLLGRFEEAHRVLKEALKKAEEAGEYRAKSYAALNLGDLYTDAGWLEDAEAAYRRAERELRAAEDRYGQGLLHLGRGRLYRKQGARALAWAELAQAEAIFKEGGSPAELAEVYLERVRLGGRGRRRWLREALAAAEEVESRRLLARVRAERVLAGEGEAEEAAFAARYALEEDLPMLLSPRYLPVWAEAGEAGRAVLERLALGVGVARVESLGRLVVLREGEEVRLPTAKELWVLLFLWLRPGEDPAVLFSEAKNPAKRVQVAVHHLRTHLGEDWVRSKEGRYRATPLPGVWWDAALLEAALAHARRPPIRELVAALYRGPLAPGAPFERERRRLSRRVRRALESD